MITIQSFRNQRCRISRRLAQRSCRRLQLEWLEDRVVPALSDGELLVATFPTTFGTPSTTFDGIVGVDPKAVVQTPVASGPFSEPTYMAEGPDGTMYVSDLTASGEGKIFAVSPNGTVSTLPITGLDGPDVLAVVNGYLVIANEADGSGAVHYLTTFNLSTGIEQNSDIPGSFAIPTGMQPVPGQNAIYLADEVTPSHVSGLYGALYKITFNTNFTTASSQTIISSGGDFDHPVDIALGGSGILVLNTGNPNTNITGSLFELDPASGVQNWIVTGPSGGGTGFGNFSGTNSVEVGSNGAIFVGEIQQSLAGQILEVTRFNSFSTLASDGNLSEIEGMRTYHSVQTAPAATNTTVSSSVNPSKVGQSVTFTATVSSSTGMLERGRPYSSPYEAGCKA
jgi:hypothetical protein